MPCYGLCHLLHFKNVLSKFSTLLTFLYIFLIFILLPSCDLHLSCDLHVKVFYTFSAKWLYLNNNAKVIKKHRLFIKYT